LNCHNLCFNVIKFSLIDFRNQNQEPRFFLVSGISNPVSVPNTKVTHIVNLRACRKITFQQPNVPAILPVIPLKWRKTALIKLDLDNKAGEKKV
jgi:hypothetical protein